MNTMILLKKYMKRIILIISLILLAAIFSSRNVEATSGDIMNIYGQIKDESGSPIQGVSVYFADEANPASITDNNGNYSVWVNSGVQGTLRYEYPNCEIKEMNKSVTITYDNMYNIDAVFSFNNENARAVYEGLVSKKISQIVTGKSKAYTPNMINTTNVITEGEDRLTLNRNSIKCIHVSYADDGIAQNIVEKLKEPGRVYARSYGLLVNPINEDVKNTLNNQTQNSILRRVFDVKEMNGIVATEILTEIYESNEFGIMRQEAPNNIGFHDNITDSISINEDREINITMKQQENTLPADTPDTISTTGITSVTDGGGDLYIDGYVKDCDNPDAKISNVLVELFKDGNKIGVTRSNSEGYYKFTEVKGPELLGYDPETGDPIYQEKMYTVHFTYGDEIQLNTEVKYNGQDYQSYKGTADVVQNTSLTENTIIETTDATIVREKEKEISVNGDKIELYLVMDCSGSMGRSSSSGQRYIDLAKVGAQNLVSQIYNTYGDNAKIGITAFGSDTEQKQSLVGKDNLNGINTTIDSLRASMRGTATGAAINNTITWMNQETSLENAKRYMLILTDGMTMDTVVAQNAYADAVNNGITPMTIFINPWQYACLTGMAESIISTLNGTDYYTVDDSNIVESLGTVAYEYIINAREVYHSSESTNYTNFSGDTVYQYTATTSSAAQDNAGRRQTVNAYSAVVTYENGKELRKLEGASTEGYGDIASNTCMLADAEVRFYYPVNFRNVNLILQERSKNEVIIQKEIDRIRLYLSDGSKLIDTKENTGINYVLDTTIAGGANGQKLITLDDEITQGATMKLTYKITVKNTSGHYSNSYKIYDYVDNILGFSAEERDDTGTLVNDKWTLIDPMDPSNKLIDSMRNNNRTIIKAEVNDDNPEVYLTLTKVLSRDDEGRYENWCEIAEYGNTEGRRIYNTTPANCNPDTGENINETDTDKSELVGVVPPFGIDSNAITIQKIILSTIIVLIMVIVSLTKMRK